MNDASKSAERSVSAFRWSFGGWFGSAAGSMAWMFGPLWDYWKAENVAGMAVMLLVIVAFASGAIGAWLIRDRLCPYVAVQGMVLGLAVTGLVAMGLSQAQPMAVEIARWLPVIPLMAAGLFFRFWLMERSASKTSRGASCDL